jgi:hypothetical protein
MNDQFDDTVYEPGWMAQVLKVAHIILIVAALAVTTPTTLWFLQRHVPDPAWYAFAGVAFVDLGAMFWFAAAEKLARGDGQKIIAWLMFGVSFLGMVAAFSLQMLNAILPDDARPFLTIYIIFVILANILAALLFAHADPDAALQRTLRHLVSKRESEHRLGAVRQAHAEEIVSDEERRLNREIRLAQKRQELARLQNTATDEHETARAIAARLAGRPSDGKSPS